MSTADARPVLPHPATVRLSTQVELSIVEIGDRGSDDVLVLLPGLSDSWRSYERVLPHVPGAIRTIAVSQRGHGDSDKPMTRYAVQDFETDLEALLDAVGVVRAVIGGHSSASLVARKFALDHPERVAGLILEGSFVTLAGRVPVEVRAQVAALTDPMSREFVREFTAGTVKHDLPVDFLEAMVDESLKVPARAWRETFASLVEYDDSLELGALACPTLVLWGDEDAIIDVEATEALVRAIPSSELVVYAGVGHTPHWEEPERFARDAASFVERCT